METVIIQVKGSVAVVVKTNDSGQGSVAVIVKTVMIQDRGQWRSS